MLLKLYIERLYILSQTYYYRDCIILKTLLTILRLMHNILQEPWKLIRISNVLNQNQLLLSKQKRIYKTNNNKCIVLVDHCCIAGKENTNIMITLFSLTQRNEDIHKKCRKLSTMYLPRSTSVARGGGGGGRGPPNNALSEFCRYIWKFVGTC